MSLGPGLKFLILSGISSLELYAHKIFFPQCREHSIETKQTATPSSEMGLSVLMNYLWLARPCSAANANASDRDLCAV